MPRALRWVRALWRRLLAFPVGVHAALPAPRHDHDLPVRGARPAWNIIAGYCGQISLGHAVFFGTGRLHLALLVKELGLTPWAGMVAGVAVAVALSQVIGYPVFRLRGHYFAIATIAVGEIVQALVVNWDAVGGARGVFVPIRRPDSLLNFQFHQIEANYYYIALGPPPPGPRGDAADRALAPGLLLPRHPRGSGRGGGLGVDVARAEAPGDGHLGGAHRHGRDVLRAVHPLHRPRVGLPPVAVDPHLPGGGARGGRHPLGAAARGRHARAAPEGTRVMLRGHRQGDRSPRSTAR